jgi:hypothetical protein
VARIVALPVCASSAVRCLLCATGARCSYDTTSGGEREIQRTMLELLNQLDGFDARGEVKVGAQHAARDTRRAGCVLHAP